MQHLLLSFFFVSTFSTTTFAIDTLSIHDLTLTAQNGKFKANGEAISADTYLTYQKENDALKNRAAGTTFWLKKLDKNDKILEQGLFCTDLTAVGNYMKYNEKGQIKYKRFFTEGRLPTCSNSTGTRAVEEIFDLANNLKIYGTYKDGVRDGQFLYYDKDGSVIGVEAYNKGQLLKRKGKIFTVNADGSFTVASSNALTVK